MRWVAKASPAHCDMLPNELDTEIPAKPRRSISRATSSVARRSPGLAISAKAGNWLGIEPLLKGLSDDTALVSPRSRAHAFAMAGFCAEGWAHTAELRAVIHALPFNRELAAGTLGRDRFRFYIQQD